jgi:hypothetical protein
VDHGYRVVLVTDAICSSSDEGHDALMRMYTSRFDIQIELASTEEAIDALAAQPVPKEPGEHVSRWFPRPEIIRGGEGTMGFASYAIIDTSKGWSVLHDGDVEGEYATKEAAFEAAVAAASLAVREGHEVHVSVPSREASNRTNLGGADPR